ncbi:MAG: aminotransferase class IV [Maledivibacter sp.]|jgi:4-amino-4-deoxychorismate lyase|nr:aminotransferase class IV [Maledivibacter sp.]
MYTCLNGKLIHIDNVHISPLNEGFSYGYGLFETIKVYEGKIFFLKEHIERMEKGIDILKLRFIYNEDIIKGYCEELIKKNKLRNGGLKISYFKNNNDPCLLITTRQNNYTEENYKKGFKLCFADIRRNPYSPIVYIKSNNYLENLLERQRAKERGFDESIFLNINQRVCEGTISNVFFIKNKTVYTPSIECGILSGILRDKVIKIINNLELKLAIGEYEKRDIYTADEIFLTNSLMDIMPVGLLEDKEFDLKINGFTMELMKEMKALYNLELYK